MSNDITPLPTPAQDRYNAAKEAHAKAEQEFTFAEAVRLRATLSATEAIEQALAQNTWLQKSKVGTKDKAIRILVRDAWRATEEYKAYDVLADEASNERRVIKFIESAQRPVDNAQNELVEDAKANVYDARALFHDVADLRQQTVYLTHWNHVRNAIVLHDVEPVEAVRKVIASVTHTLLQGHTQRALSRSTSVISNLIEDIDNEANAQWIAIANAAVTL